VVGDSASSRIADLTGIEGVEKHAGALLQTIANLCSASVAGSGVHEAEDGDFQAEVILLGKSWCQVGGDVTGRQPGTTVPVCYLPGWRARVPAAQA
jgi:hypothetical protein